MTEFLGGSPRLVEAKNAKGSESEGVIEEEKLSELMEVNSKVDKAGGTKRRSREDGEESRIGMNSWGEKLHTPIGLDEIKESGEFISPSKVKGVGNEGKDLDSLVVIPFGNLRRVDECDKGTKEGKGLSRSQRKRLAKKARVANDLPHTHL